LTTGKQWSSQSAIDYYAQHRHDVADLYPSETVFLPRVLFPGAKVLDVGCASGGFFNIMRSYEPAVEYTGIDLSATAVEMAQARYPEATFVLNEGFSLPFDDNTFDLVHCTSVFNNEPNYKTILEEMYRVTNRFALADIRLLKGIGNQRSTTYNIQFESNGIEDTVPYVVNDADDVVNFILQLDPKPKALRGTGYFHPVAKEADPLDSEICMTILLLEKGDATGAQTVFDLDDLPIQFSVTQS
jgi:SAM-dependent methyltransferase